MRITVFRQPSKGGTTIGDVYVDGAFFCHSLEDEIREIAGQPVAAWKIPRQTAIPSGKYRVSLEYSPRFGPNTLTVNDVPGFSGIRIHAGNTAGDTEGCILLGTQVKGICLVAGTSKPAVALVRAAVERAVARGEQVWLDVNNPTAQA